MKRVHWGFFDQVLSSATNFALSVAVARQVDPRAFGAFGVALTAYILATGLSRAVVSEPLLVGFSAAPDHVRRQGFADATGTSLVLGVVGGAVCLAGAWAVGGPVFAPMAALGVLLPLLLLQDAWRYAFLAGGRPKAAAANDGVWAVAQVATIAVCVVAGTRSAGPYVLAWAAAAAVAALYGIRQAGVVPRVTRTGAWLRAQREQAPRYSAEFVARAGAQQAATVAVGAVAGLAALGGIRAAQALLGPLRVFLLAAPLVFIPEAVRLREEDPTRVLGLVRRVSFGLAGLALLAGVVSLALPDSLGRALVGESWELARPALLPQAVLMATIGINAGALAGLRALSDPRRSLRARLSVVPLSILGGVGGALLTGTAAGALWGLAAGNAAGAAIWWVLFKRSLDEFESGRRLVAPLPDLVVLGAGVEAGIPAQHLGGPEPGDGA